MSQSAYAKIEGGKRRIEAGLLFKIAEELDENVERFIDDRHKAFKINNKKFDVHTDSSFNQHFHPAQVEVYEEHIKLLREEIAEMRKERKELIALLKGKM